MIDLCGLDINQKGRIYKVDIDDKKRLLEIGFIKGREIEKLFESFNKSVCGFKINGTIIGLRKSECRKIIVEIGG